MVVFLSPRTPGVIRAGPGNTLGAAGAFGCRACGLMGQRSSVFVIRPVDRSAGRDVSWEALPEERKWCTVSFFGALFRGFGGVPSVVVCGQRWSGVGLIRLGMILGSTFGRSGIQVPPTPTPHPTHHTHPPTRTHTHHPTPLRVWVRLVVDLGSICGRSGIVLRSTWGRPFDRH